ncbi:glycosyltransferase [Patescibacteria group bacterium]|nr:MAG: glycosyltransferase [Patescibacteria group bacterium]
MRIAFIGQKGIPTVAGGVERYVEEVSTRLVAMGHEVTVYVRNNYTDRKLREFKGVRLVHLPSIPTKNLDAISHTFLATMHALFSRYDVVHYQAIGPTSLAWILKLFKSRTAVIATFQCQDYFHQKWGWLAQAYLRFGERMTCTQTDRTIVVSQILKDYARVAYQCEAVCIPNGADVELTSKTQALGRWELKEKKYILSVGRLIRHKGIRYLIEAFKHLEDRSKIPNGFKLVIVGDGFHTDDYVDELKRLAGGRRNIVFTGTQNNGTLQQLFSHAYCFVQPSESEGLSLALLEAMAYGLAPIVSDIPENAQVVKESGIIFKSKDVADLEQKLASVINQPDETERLGQAAKRAAQEKYGWDTIVKQIMEVYQSTIEVKRRKK